jgi:RNA polymerase sigma factor (sigma-70 family)
MRAHSLGIVVRQLRHVVSPAAPPTGTDAELVRAFAARRDPAAFEQIVRRHGPMVLGVCRRVLRDSADADDAFQATFLVLVRKARSLRQPERLAGWLHQVAHRTSRKLRTARATRHGREGELFDVPAGESPAEFVWRELRPIFDEELNRLPDKLRLPAVLCFLEGRSKGEAARALGWPEGTLSGRLHRAREKLRTRLAARGLTLSAGALAVALFDGVGAAAVPASLISCTISLATAGGTGLPVAVALADGVVQTMFVTKVKAITAAVLVAGMIGAGTGVVLVPGSGSGEVVAGDPERKPPKDPPATPKEAKAPDAPKKSGGNSIEDRERALLQGELKILKDRLEYERQMVRKGFMTQEQVRKTELEIAHVELDLAKRDAPKAPDPRQALFDEAIRKMEEIVSKTGDGVRRGIVPQQELLNAEVALINMKLKIAELSDRRPPTTAVATPDARRTLLDEQIRKLEEIVSKTEDGVKKGIVPEQELLNAQVTLINAKLKVAELGVGPLAPAKGSVSDMRRTLLDDTVQKLERIVQKIEEEVKKGLAPEVDLLNAQATLNNYKLKRLNMLDTPVAPDPRHIEALKALVTQTERELTRAEALLKSNAVSQDEVRRLRVEHARRQADLAEATGGHATAAKHREAVVIGSEEGAKLARAMAERGAVSQAEVRAQEVAVAEAKVEALKAGIRLQLAQIVAVREKDFADAKAMYQAKTLSAQELRRIEQALIDAKRRLAEGR